MVHLSDILPICCCGPNLSVFGSNKQGISYIGCCYWERWFSNFLFLAADSSVLMEPNGLQQTSPLTHRTIGMPLLVVFS